METIIINGKVIKPINGFIRVDIGDVYKYFTSEKIAKLLEFDKKILKKGFIIGNFSSNYE